MSEFSRSRAKCNSTSCNAWAIFRVTYKAAAAGEGTLCADCTLALDRHIATRVSLVGEDRPGPVRDGQPETAALAATSVKNGSQRSVALAALARAGAEGLTDYELSKAMRHPRPHVAGTRRHELEEMGLVEPSLERRLTDTGSPAVVWRVTAAGAEEARRLAAASAA